MKNVPGDCYNVVEGLARALLRNKTVLRDNKQELLRVLSLSPKWGYILSNYIEYTFEFRHASKNRGDIDRLEVEGLVYLTGLLTRLIIEKMAERTGAKTQPPEGGCTQK